VLYITISCFKYLPCESRNYYRIGVGFRRTENIVQPSLDIIIIIIMICDAVGAATNSSNLSVDLQRAFVWIPRLSLYIIRYADNLWLITEITRYIIIIKGIITNYKLSDKYKIIFYIEV